MPVQYVTRPHRYADGKAYRPNLRAIHVLEAGGPSVRRVGGLIALNGKFLAFASDHAVHLLQSKVPTILRDAKAYAWGSTAREALLGVREHLSC